MEKTFYWECFLFLESFQICLLESSTRTRQHNSIIKRLCQMQTIDVRSDRLRRPFHCSVFLHQIWHWVSSLHVLYCILNCILMEVCVQQLFLDISRNEYNIYVISYTFLDVWCPKTPDDVAYVIDSASASFLNVHSDIRYIDCSLGYFQCVIDHDFNVRHV